MSSRSERWGEEAAPDANGPRTGLLLDDTYLVLHKIGGGNSGDVYEAENGRVKKRFAVKFLRADALERLQTFRRFRREIQMLAGLESEHIVGIVDAGELADRTPYFVMERLNGRDLRAILDEEGTLSPRRALSIVMDVCRGLDVAHAAGFVHRDLKPANLFITTRANGEEVCKLLDFGVAKSVESEATQPGAVIGTFRYMAPEQLTDSASVDARADTYAVGAILYECLCGQPARSGKTAEEIMFNVLNRDVEPIRARCPAVPEALERILMRTLSRDVAARFASASELLQALAPFLRRSFEPAVGDITETERSSVAPPAAPEAKRRWIDLRAALLFACGALAGVLGARAHLAAERSASTPALEGPRAAITERAPVGREPPAPSSSNARTAVHVTDVSAATATTLTTVTTASAAPRLSGHQKPPPGPRSTPPRNRSELRHSTALDEKNPYAP